MEVIKRKRLDLSRFPIRECRCRDFHEQIVPIFEIPFQREWGISFAFDRYTALKSNRPVHVLKFISREFEQLLELMLASQFVFNRLSCASSRDYRSFESANR